MKKLLIYPFTKEMCPLARYRNQLKEYELIAAIPAHGFGWEGKDVCEIDGGTPTGFILGGIFSDELKRCDAVLFNACDKNMEKEYAEYEKLAHMSVKEFVTAIPNVIPEPEITQSDLKLKEIPIPVVMVMGLGENCQKFDIQLSLRDTFIKSGYKVSQFGTKSYSMLFGFDSLPDMPETSLWKKTYLYNNLFWEAYKREKPDILIVGVPGGIMPTTSYAYERFGETALALSYAARPDIAFLSYYHVVPTEEYFEMLRQYARYRLGAMNINFHASNTKLIVDNDIHALSYLTLKSQFVLDEAARHVPDMLPHIFNSLTPESSEPAYLKIIEILQQNVSLI